MNNVDHSNDERTMYHSGRYSLSGNPLKLIQLSSNQTPCQTNENPKFGASWETYSDSSTRDKLVWNCVNINTVEPQSATNQFSKLILSNEVSKLLYMILYASIITYKDINTLRKICIQCLTGFTLKMFSMIIIVIINIIF